MEENVDNVNSQQIYEQTCISPAKFVENIEAFLAKSENGNDVNSVLKKFDDQLANYKMIEMTLLNNRKKLKAKIPELEASLNVIEKLREKSEKIEQLFPFSDQAFLKSVVNDNENVYLHLGANIIVQYKIDEADQVLNTHIDTAKKNLERIESDWETVKDQIIITEVNMARIHNWRVKNTNSLQKA